MISYTISMTFIASMMAIMMWLGFLLIKLFEWDLQDENSKSDSMSKTNAEMLLQEYNDNNVIGRAVMVLTLGARYLAILFGLMRKEKD